MRTLEQIQDNWRQYGFEHTIPFPAATDFLANGQVVCRHHRHVDVPVDSWCFEGSVLTTRGLHLVDGLLNNILIGREPVSLSIPDLMHLWEELGGEVTNSNFYYDGIVVAKVEGGEILRFEGTPLKSEADLENLMTTCEDLALHEAVNDLVDWWEGQGMRCEQNGHSISFVHPGIQHSETLGTFWSPGTVAVWEADKMLMGDALLYSGGVKKCTLAELRALLEASLLGHPLTS